MKLYGFDEEIILSGANLSQDYFTNRQDRYFLFSSKSLTDYFSKLHFAVSGLSYEAIPAKEEPGGYLLRWPGTNSCPTPLDDPESFIRAAQSRIAPLLLPLTPSSNTPALSQTDTSIYPISQFTPLLKHNDTSTELPVLQKLLKALLIEPALQDSTYTFTAGYFNIHPSLSSILTSTSSKGTVVTASQYANGFFNSAGVSGMLPGAYTLLSRRFLEAAQKKGTLANITLREWRKGTVGDPDGWTYHAKGIWINLPGQTGPSVTLIGSSNYTQRSYSLDLESNALIFTKSEGLKQKLKEEVEYLEKDTKPVSLDEFGSFERRVGIKTRISMWIVKLVGGAL
jgi:CDP-diacylglycerol--glycerol-3-phosphate 3-phosphatidyltransferase